jgi:hypothetical protein
MQEIGHSTAQFFAFSKGDSLMQDKKSSPLFFRGFGVGILRRERMFRASTVRKFFHHIRESYFWEFGVQGFGGMARHK